MAYEANVKTGLPKNIDADDTNWTTKLLAAFNQFETRISKTSNGDPNGNTAGEWYGQPCWNSAASVIYECTKPGPATGATRATWQPSSGVPVGTIASFWRTAIPTGWLPFSGGLYVASAYPQLFAVLPAGVTKTATNFTLPNLRGGIMLTRYPDGGEPVYDTVGQVSASNDVGVATSTEFSYRVINVIMGIKY
jgi:hypothetical protein